MGTRNHIQSNYFCKEQHETILPMHLTKFPKSEKWKSAKLKFVNENYIYCSWAIIFQKNPDLYTVYLFSEYADD